MSFEAAGWDYTQEDIVKSTARQALSDGWYQFAVDFGTAKVNEKTGDAFVQYRVSPVNPDTEQRAKPPMYLRITLPLRNPDTETFPDHTPPDWAAGITGEFARALDPETYPAGPRKVDGVWQFNGEEIDAEDVEEKKQEVAKGVFDFSKAILKDPNMLKDNTFYGRVVTDGEFQNVKNLRSELPADAALVPASEFKKAGAPAKAAASTPAKSNGTAKPASASKTAAKGKK